MKHLKIIQKEYCLCLIIICLIKLFNVKGKTTLYLLIEEIKIMKKIFSDLFIACYLFSLYNLYLNI